jgi:hypothetical protein
MAGPFFSNIKNQAMSNFTIDFQTKQLTMLDARFYTTDEGGYVPSVTTILEAYPKDYGYYQWLKTVGQDADEIRDEAGRRGSIVHELTERYDAGEEVTLLTDTGRLGFKLNEWSMFERYIDFSTRFPHVVELREQNFVSRELGFAGTVDRVIEMDGKTILIDIKTSNAIYPTYWLQLAAYEKLITKARGFNPIDEVAILWLNAKTRTNGKKGDIQGAGWQMITKDDTTSDWELFQATHKLWMAQNGDASPKNLSYKIGYKK